MPRAISQGVGVPEPEEVLGVESINFTSDEVESVGVIVNEVTA